MTGAGLEPQRPDKVSQMLAQRWALGGGYSPKQQQHAESVRVTVVSNSPYFSREASGRSWLHHCSCSSRYLTGS